MTSNTQQLLELVERAGLTGAEAIEFVREQQELARAERLQAREEAERAREQAREEAERAREQAREEAERAREEAERARQHELEVLRIREGSDQPNDDRNIRIKKAPKLPSFSENSDPMDSYLQRFERFATANG